MAMSESRRSDQSAIWEEIALKAACLNASSPTQAMNEIYTSRAISLDAYLRAFVWAEGQTGVAFAIGAAMGLDLMDHPHALRAMFRSWFGAMRWMPWKCRTRLCVLLRHGACNCRKSLVRRRWSHGQSGRSRTSVVIKAFM